MKRALEMLGYGPCCHMYEVIPHRERISVCERNLAEVRAAFGPDRLLSYELGSGRAPLCRFLGRDIPDAPYPSGNESDDFHARDKALGALRDGEDAATGEAGQG